MEHYLEVCQAAARLGGQVIQQWLGRAEVRKKGPADLVTQADLASQEAVRGAVLSAFPDHDFLGEESTSNRPAARRSEYRWIVDPLDVTTNFSHGAPHYCVSLALERQGELLVGTVYDPVHDQCFSAAVGQGAHLNGRPIHTSDVVDLSESLAAVGFPPNPSRDAPDLRMFLEMVYRCQAIRRSGSAALNLCYLAAGWYDVFWSYATRIWDIAAGVLIVQEAGGVVTSPAGGKFVLEQAHFLAAANSALHGQLLDAATAAVGNPDAP
ncbi:MAG: inositol monophosphatase family protein [Thermoguttaceae bacterium]